MLIFYDDFNGKLIDARNCLFYANGILLKPIIKPEGYVVFVNLDANTQHITVVSEKFQEYSYTISQASGSNAQAITVRLLRNAKKSFPDCVFVVGKLSNHGKNRSVILKSNIEYRIQGIINENSFNALTLQNLVGLRFSFSNDNKPMIITGKNVDGTYQSDISIKKSLRTEKTILRTYYGVCDKDGNYAIPVDIGQELVVKDVLRSAQ